MYKSLKRRIIEGIGKGEESRKLITRNGGITEAKNQTKGEIATTLMKPWYF